MIYNKKHYASGTFMFPDRDNKNLDKDSKEYNLQVAQYVYSLFCKGGTAVDYQWYNSVRENRKYALGQQDQQKYMDAFYGKESENNVLQAQSHENTRLSRRKAFANLNFEIQSPMPRVMDSVVGKLMGLVNRVSVDAGDKYSGAERETLKWGTYVDGKFKEQFDSLRALGNLPVPDVGYTPSNTEELNLYESEGGFKLPYEETMETLLKYSFEQSYFEENVLERIITDLVTNGFAIVEDVYDRSSGLVKAVYRDAEYSGVQYTKEDGYRNPDYGFFIEMVKLSDLRKMGYDDERLESAAKTFSEMYGNPNIDDWNATNKNQHGVTSGGTYDVFVVPVITVKWIDVEFKNEKQYKNRQGKKRTKPVDKDYKLKKSEELLSTRIKTVRETSWVLGTDIVYNYGKAKFQGRDGLADPVLPIHMVKVTGRPIVPRLRPALDQYMNAWMRLQQGISMAAMNGYAINMDAISNLQMGGTKMSPKEVLRFWRQTGTLFFKPTDTAGRQINGMVSRPIEQLAGGAGAVIQESVQVMDLAMRQIEELTGINPVAMGAQPSPDQGKAVTEFALVGTNEILKGVLKQANVLKSDVARAMCLRLSHVISSDSTARKAYKDVIGETKFELLKIADGHDVRYGIRTHARPTEQDIRELKEVIALSLKNGRDGKVGITEADAVRFNAMINSGASLKRVALLLDFANKKAQREAEERAMRARELDMQGAQQAQMQKEQSESRAKEMETVSEIAITNAKAMGSVIEKAVQEGRLQWEDAMIMLGGQLPQGVQEQPQPQQFTQSPEQMMPQQEDAV